MKLITNFIHQTSDNEYWKISTIISIIIYLIIISTKFAEWDNFFLISMLIGLQFYFLIGRQKEIYTFTPHQLYISIFCINKTLHFDAFSISEKTIIDRDSHNHKREFLQIQLFNKQQKVYAFNQYQDPYLFDEVFDYLNLHSTKINHTSTTKEKYFPKQRILIQLILTSIITIFSFGYFYESLSPQPNALKAVNGKMRYSPEEYISESTRNSTFQYRIHLINFNKMFIVHTEDYNKTNREQLLQAKDSITLYVDRNDFDYAYGLIDKPYFSSHLTNKKIVSIKKIKYQDEFLLDSDLSDNKFDLFHLIIIIAPLLALGYTLYQFNKIYS